MQKATDAFVLPQKATDAFVLARRCPECGEEFHPQWPAQKYCSKNCRREHGRERRNYLARRRYHRQKRVNRCSSCGVIVKRYKQVCEECRLGRGMAKYLALLFKISFALKRNRILKDLLDRSESMVQSLQVQVDELNEKNRELLDEMKKGGLRGLPVGFGEESKERRVTFLPTGLGKRQRTPSSYRRRQRD